MIRRGKDIKNVFFHDSKCGEIRYGGVKYFSVDEIWTDFLAALWYYERQSHYFTKTA